MRWLALFLCAGCDVLFLDRHEGTCLDFDQDPESGAYYKAQSITRQFSSAAAACAGGTKDTGFRHLPVISTAVELARLSLAHPNAWVGLSNRKAPDAYLWITAEPVPVDDAYWAQSPPRATSCAVVNNQGKLDVHDCSDSGVRIVCECDAFENDPTRY